RKRSRCTENERFAFFIHQPDGDGERFEHIGHQSDEGPAEIGPFHARCGALVEFLPHGTVVVEWSLEVSADKTAEGEADAVGLNQDREQDERNEANERFEREGGVAAKITNEFREQADENQVDAREQDGERTLKNKLRGINVQVETTGTKKRTQHEHRADEGGS